MCSEGILGSKAAKLPHIPASSAPYWTAYLFILTVFTIVTTFLIIYLYFLSVGGKAALYGGYKSQYW